MCKSARLCKGGAETVDHVLNVCTEVTRSELVIQKKDLYDDNEDTIREVVCRFKLFLVKVDNLNAQEKNN